LFLQNAGDRKIGFVAQRAKPANGFVFSNPPIGIREQGDPNRRLALFFAKPLATPRLGSLRSAANQPIGFVFSNPPNGIWGRGARTVGWVCFYKLPALPRNRQGRGYAPPNS
jgi:hypothetical protein